jgi:hypothetical protein
MMVLLSPISPIGIWLSLSSPPSPPTMKVSFFPSYPPCQLSTTPLTILLLCPQPQPPPLPLPLGHKPPPQPSALSTDSAELTIRHSSKTFICLAQTGVIARVARRATEWYLMAGRIIESAGDIGLNWVFMGLSFWAISCELL